VVYAAVAPTRDKAGALPGQQLQSDAGNICISWTKAREAACKNATQKVKQLVPGAEQKPFGLIETEKSQTTLEYRILLPGDTPKQGERGLNCEKGRVQQGFRRSSVDIVTIDDPESLVASAQATDPRLTARDTPQDTAKKATPTKPKGGGKCFDDGEVEKAVGSGCGQGDGTKQASDPNTCKNGVVCIKQSPLSDQARQKMQRVARCFKEKEASRVQKDAREFTKGIQYNTVCYCADDAQRMAQITAEEAQRDQVTNDIEKDQTPPRTRVPVRTVRPL
jgi:hypothetical protein